METNGVISPAEASAALASRFIWWSTIPAGVLVFALFAGTGLMLSARGGRR